MNMNPEWLRADAAIEFWGEEISWELLATEGKWYVTASHTGDEDDAVNFKFNAAHETIDGAVAAISRQLFREGPAWVNKRTGRIRA